MRTRVLIVLAVCVAFAAVTAVAEGAFRFGSKLDSTVQPSNAETAHTRAPKVIRGAAAPGS